jgi:predicted nucleic acid-binding protein
VALFVDTSAFYALADESDAEHERVLALYQARAGAGDLLTTDYVVVESWLLLRARLGVDSARRFWRGIRNGAVTIVGVGGDDLERAWALDEKYHDQGFGLVDASSFAVIERLGVGEALSLDAHFRVIRLGRRRRALTVIP